MALEINFRPRPLSSPTAGIVVQSYNKISASQQTDKFQIRFYYHCENKQNILPQLKQIIKPLNTYTQKKQ